MILLCGVFPWFLRQFFGRGEESITHAAFITKELQCHLLEGGGFIRHDRVMYLRAPSTKLQHNLHTAIRQSLKTKSCTTQSSLYGPVYTMECN